MSLPQNLLYLPKPVAVRSRSYRSSVPTSNKSSFNAGDTMRFDIPCGQYGTYMNNSQSYLKFKVANTDGVTLTVQRHIASVFKNLSIYHAGNLLESIEDYGSLYCTLVDCQVNAEDCQTVLSFQGCATHASNNVALAGETMATGTDKWFVMPIALSGVLGSQLGRYLPIGSMGGSDLRCEFQLNPLAKIIQCADANLASSEFTISEAEFVTQIIELDPVAQAEIDRQSQGVLQISSESYRHYSTTKSTESNVVFNIPAKFSSLKGIIVVHRSTADAIQLVTGDAQSRTTAGLGSYNFRLGSLLVPQKAVIVNKSGATSGEDGAEAWMEVEKLFASVSNIDSHSRITRASYGISDASANGTFLIGMELESFSGSSTELLEQGINTLSTGVFFEGTYDNTPIACNIDSWVNYDMMLVVSDGICSARF